MDSSGKGQLVGFLGDGPESIPPTSTRLSATALSTAAWLTVAGLVAVPSFTVEPMAAATTSSVVLDEEYEKALAEDKVLVLAWDSATGRLVTTTFDLD